MSIGYYKRLVRMCLRKATEAAGIYSEGLIELKMREYEDEFPEFLEKDYSPQAAATAILLNL